ncbi:hypothetical protein EJB05_35593 [Eragrostis curvula]|uniref:Fe2OG dioxygenase domain-containing protein n=1 Tax=Eragrostis curvula TaxID=38414 RepID=A0A5J9U776_9POAL|nr:hypothetical protein EJB05_35593 [Eragrostis curvula]
MEVGSRVVVPVAPADESHGEENGYRVVDIWHQRKIPDSFVWPLADALPSSDRELDAPVVDIGAAMRGGGDALRRAVEQVAAACASHGLFQVTGHGVDPALARAALDGAAEFFLLPLATKLRVRRTPGTVTGYAVAHADRFAENLPWKETLSFGHRDDHPTANSDVVDYFASSLGSDFKPLGEVFQDYCQSMKEVSLAIMEVLGQSLGVGRSYCRDFFTDGCYTMRCNYYPPCPEPDRTLGTGPHCDPAALTLLLQDDAVDGLQVLVDGEWRPVRPKPGALVVNIGDTFTALSNGRYKSCLHREVVHRERERRSLAFFLCPRDDRVVRPPPRLTQAQPRRYPDFTWADLKRFTQCHYRADTRTLDAFARWLGDGPSTSPGAGN